MLVEKCIKFANPYDKFIPSTDAFNKYGDVVQSPYSTRTNGMENVWLWIKDSSFHSTSSSPVQILFSKDTFLFSPKIRNLQHGLINISFAWPKHVTHKLLLPACRNPSESKRPKAARQPRDGLVIRWIFTILLCTHGHTWHTHPNAGGDSLEFGFLFMHHSRANTNAAQPS